MYCVDTSSILHAWANYPEEQFPSVWRWMEKQIKAGNFLIPEIVKNEATDVRDWFVGKRLPTVAISDEIYKTAQSIEGGLGIQNGNYSPKGVNENDVIIIATAMVKGWAIVTEEGEQQQLPPKGKHYKMPAACHKNNIQVGNFLARLIESGEIFGP